MCSSDLILKKELLKIPIFGLYLKKIGSISIERNKTTKENLGFFDKISNSINKTNRPLLIFPQGTRVLPLEKPKFKKGLQDTIEELASKREEITYYDFAYSLLKDDGVKTKIIKRYNPFINQQVNRYLQLMDFYINFTLDEEFL